LRKNAQRSMEALERGKEKAITGGGQINPNVSLRNGGRKKGILKKVE